MQKQINTINHFINCKITKETVAKFIDIHQSRKANETIIIEKITSIIIDKVKVTAEIVSKSNLKDTIKSIMTDDLLAETRMRNFDEKLSKELNLIQL